VQNTEIYSMSELLPMEGSGNRRSVQVTSNLTIVAGQALVAETTAAANDVQTLAETGSPTGGTFKLTFMGQQTAAIAYNASAATIQAALQALSTIGSGNVTCTGTTIDAGNIVCTFGGAMANLPQQAMTVDYSGLTGGTSPTITVTHTTTGVANGRYKAYAGSGRPVFSRYAFTSDQYGQVSVSGTGANSKRQDAEVWYAGLFFYPQLGNMDSSGVTAVMGNFISGTSTDGKGLLLIPGVPV